MANYELASRRLLHERARALARRHWYVFLALLALMISWYFTLAPSSLGGPITYASVSGHSMEPSLYTGDLVMVQKQDSYEIGDTVLTSVMGGLVIHKIVWLSATSVKTQGINNDFADTWTLPKSAIMGKQIFVLKQLGTYLVTLRTNPLAFGLFASVFGGLLLINPRRTRHNKRLKEILDSAQPEVAQTRKNYLNSVLVGLYVLAGGSLISTGILLANQTKFYPRVLLSLSGVAISIIAFEIVGGWLAAAKDLPEPDQSIAIFSKRLYRLRADVHIPGQTQPVAKASELMAFADIAHTPVLHLVLDEGQVHKFLVVTDELNYAYTIDMQAIASHKTGRHKK
ncbi:MAG: hypothetical protein RL196_1348 [Actinomycetota bacterium]|jgi:signal peptidase